MTLTKTKKNKTNTKYREEFILKAYLLAKEGLKNHQIALSMSVGIKEVVSWMKKHPAFKEAIELGRRGMDGAKTFHDFVLNRLTPDLRKLWKELISLNKRKASQDTVDRLFTHAGGRTARMRLYVHALVSSNFNGSEACRKLCISRIAVHNWCQNYPEFKRLLGEVEVQKKDFFEAALIDLVARGDPHAVVFVNKTVNRDRGYNDKVQVDVSGTITHVTTDDLDLPIEVRRQILKALRDKKEKDSEVARLGYSGEKDDKETEDAEYEESTAGGAK